MKITHIIALVLLLIALLFVSGFAPDMSMRMGHGGGGTVVEPGDVVLWDVTGDAVLWDVSGDKVIWH